MNWMTCWTSLHTSTNPWRDPADGQILEIAVYIADMMPFKFYGAQMLTIEPNQDIDVLASAMSSGLSHAYERNQLLPQLRAGVHVTLDTAEKELLKTLQDYAGDPDDAPVVLGGNALATEVVPWLRMYLPELYDTWFVHAVHLDLETVGAAYSMLDIDDVVPIYEQANPTRSISMCERYCAEYDFHLRLLQTIPLKPIEES